MANMQSKKGTQDVSEADMPEVPGDPVPGDAPVIDGTQNIDDDPNLMAPEAPQISEEPVVEQTVGLTVADSEGLRWTGKGDRRVITIKDLQSLGVTDFKHEGDLVWEADNERTIPIDVISEETAEALVRLKDFQLV